MRRNSNTDHTAAAMCPRALLSRAFAFASVRVRGQLLAEAEQASATSGYLSSGAEDASGQTEGWLVMSLSAASLPTPLRTRRMRPLLVILGRRAPQSAFAFT